MYVPNFNYYNMFSHIAAKIEPIKPTDMMGVTNALCVKESPKWKYTIKNHY